MHWMNYCIHWRTFKVSNNLYAALMGLKGLSKDNGHEIN